VVTLEGGCGKLEVNQIKELAAYHTTALGVAFDSGSERIAQHEWTLDRE